MNCSINVQISNLELIKMKAKGDDLNETVELVEFACDSAARVLREIVEDHLGAEIKIDSHLSYDEPFLKSINIKL